MRPSAGRERRPVFPLGAGIVVACTAGEPPAPSVMTVSGPVALELLGTTLLSHEHVLLDFAGAEAATPERYDREEVFATVLRISSGREHSVSRPSSTSTGRSPWGTP